LMQGFSTQPAQPFSSYAAAKKRMVGVLDYYHTKPDAPVYRKPPITDGEIVMVTLKEISSIKDVK
ncbi:hypothetical protein LMP56_14625, partial [Staphylococcus aureus]|uniref:hypothetical protein n=1 Tax=Staphylococcus aureus TaxID=1280 RepID=UPI001E61447B